MNIPIFIMSASTNVPSGLPRRRRRLPLPRLERVQVPLAVRARRPLLDVDVAAVVGAEAVARLLKALRARAGHWSENAAPLGTQKELAE